MSYFDGVARADAAMMAKCDPRKGWRRQGNKCVRKGAAKRIAD